jgi:riboflavin biosynthesis pyrimidine reductase
MKRVLISWSSGKDCAWSLHLLRQQPDIEIVGLPKTDGQIAPAAILSALAERGMRRILIEGGADTVSRFLAAQCLDRLHIIVAPIILGSGRPSFTLPPIARVDEAVLTPIGVHRLDDEVLFDCDLSGQRVAVGRAKKST